MHDYLIKSIYLTATRKSRSKGISEVNVTGTYIHTVVYNFQYITYHPTVFIFSPLFQDQWIFTEI